MVVKKMKEKCKDAARMRREKERIEFLELSKLLPLPSSTTNQLDKASIIRLTSSYLRMRAAFPLGLGGNWGTQRRHSCCSSAEIDSSLSHGGFISKHNAQCAVESSNCTNQKLELPALKSNGRPQAQLPLRELGSLILQTLDGFVFALHKDGKIMYISETASVQLGLSQIDLTGSSIFDYAHPADHSDIHRLLSLNDGDRSSLEGETAEHCELGRSFCMRMKCILPKRNAGLVSSGYKTIHCNGYLKVKYQTSSSYDSKSSALCSIMQPQSSATSELANQNQHRKGSNWESYALVAVGHSLLPTATTEYKMSANSFMFRANLDLKIYFIESQATQMIGYDQTDMIDQSLYQFVHLFDVGNLEQGHRTLLDKGQLVSPYFRLMIRGGGFAWVQAYAILVNNPRSLPKPQHIVAVCYVIGEDLEDRSCSMHDVSQIAIADSMKQVSTAANISRLLVERKRKDHSSSETHKKVQRKSQSCGSDEVMSHSETLELNINQELQSWNNQNINSNPECRIVHSKDEDAIKYMTIGSTRRASDDSCSIVSSVASTSFSSTSPCNDKSRTSYPSNDHSDILHLNVIENTSVTDVISTNHLQRPIWTKHTPYIGAEVSAQPLTRDDRDRMYSNFVELDTKQLTNIEPLYQLDTHHSDSTDRLVYKSATENNQDPETKLNNFESRVHLADVASGTDECWYYDSNYHQTVQYDVICCDRNVEQLYPTQYHHGTSSADFRFNYGQDSTTGQQVAELQMI